MFLETHRPTLPPCFAHTQSSCWCQRQKAAFADCRLLPLLGWHLLPGSLENIQALCGWHWPASTPQSKPSCTGVNSKGIPYHFTTMRTLWLLKFSYIITRSSSHTSRKRGKKQEASQEIRNNRGCQGGRESQQGEPGEVILIPSVETCRSNDPGHMLAKH